MISVGPKGDVIETVGFGSQAAVEVRLRELPAYLRQQTREGISSFFGSGPRPDTVVFGAVH